MTNNIIAARVGRYAAIAVATLALASVSACNSTEPASTAAKAQRVRFTLDNAAGQALVLDPRTATLYVGYGIAVRAALTDENGQPLTGVRPEWRSTDESVARVIVWPDSANQVNNGLRASIVAVSVGTARVIVSYQGSADTALITVAERPERPDTATTNPRTVPDKFEAGIYVSTSIDTTLLASWRREPVVGATVRVVQLPLQPGDVVPPTAQRVSQPTLIATAVTDTGGFVVVRDIPMSRFRIEVRPASGSAWIDGNFEYGPPGLSSIRTEVRVPKR